MTPEIQEAARKACPVHARVIPMKEATEGMLICICERLASAILQAVEQEARCYYCCSCAQSMCPHSREHCRYCKEREGGGINVHALVEQARQEQREKDLEIAANCYHGPGDHGCSHGREIAVAIRKGEP